MPKNLVICSDGTGNTFTQHESNVSRLVRALDLSNCKAQQVFYDQGIGTNPHLARGLEKFRTEPGTQRHGLEMLPEPKVTPGRPLATLAGLAAGYGLYANVEQLYRALAKYHEPHDRIFLFGFSRGAFTVRALAGLLYRCALPASHVADDEGTFRRCFKEAWEAYKPHCEDWKRIDRFRDMYGAADVEVHFLGLWDTVKSYGGVWPQSLPHLRHNPIVRRVCHALSLDERRSWFLPTSWGGIGIDKKNEATIRPDPRYHTQRVQEVWFTGCHSDIGGGDAEAETAKITFRWIVGHATDDHGKLRLNPSAESWIFDPEPLAVCPEIHQSYHFGWWLSDLIPRWELDNSQRPPGYPLKWPGRGKRCAEQFRRNGEVCFHSSVGVAARHGIRVVETTAPRPAVVSPPSAAVATERTPPPYFG